MPFDLDPKYVETTETTEPSLEGLIAFCERFPADKPYNWTDPKICLVAAYARTIGRDYEDISDVPVPAPATWTLDYPYTLDYLALQTHPRTYGAAAALARSIVAEHSQ